MPSKEMIELKERAERLVKNTDATYFKNQAISVLNIFIDQVNKELNTDSVSEAAGMPIGLSDNRPD